MTKSLDCACVIHGDKYDWIYVERLYNMLKQNLSCDVKFHVFTESQRPVPSHMIKHELIDWPGISGPRKSWWYKMQMFDPSRISGQILYLDLDVIIVDQLDWLLDLDTRYFWTIRDWKYLWRPSWQGVNSSVMYWNTVEFGKIWDEFQTAGAIKIAGKYRGDQDFISDALAEKSKRFFVESWVLSYRWQVQDGGLDPKTRKYRYPGAGSVLTPGAKILVFHGSPKPHEIIDPFVQNLWVCGSN